MSEVTLLIEAARAGVPGSEERLWEAVYQELRGIAGQAMSREAREITLSGTALVHEAWLRISNGDGQALAWESRAHFFAAAAEAMRRILVEQARSRKRQKRGGGAAHEPLDEATCVAAPEEDDKLLLVHEVLDDLAREDPQKAHIVKLRFFVGFTHDEIADQLGVSEKTVQREWKVAKAWLFQALKPADPSGTASGKEITDL